MKGRKPIPTNIKVIRGEKNKDRINNDEPQPKPAVGIRPPEWLADEGKAEWGRIAQQLCDIGIVTDIDYVILVGYCTAWAKFVAAEKAINEKGFPAGQVYKTEKGNWSTNPFDWISNKAQEQLLKYAAELGIGASSRSRIKAVKKGEDAVGLALI